MNFLKIVFAFVSLIFFTQTNFANSKPKAKKEFFMVEGNCGMCKKAIETAVFTKGVLAANWNPDNKKLAVKYLPNQVSPQIFLLQVSEAGYDNQLYKADSAAYFSLQKCCQYRSQKCSH